MPFLEYHDNKSAELVVKKSKFISFIFPCKSLEELKNKKSELSLIHKGAKHIVYAGVFGQNGSILSASDDREPHGTAGKPILNILVGKKYTNIGSIVVRYFGGTLLGTGNLSRAYSDSVKKAFES